MFSLTNSRKHVINNSSHCHTQNPKLTMSQTQNTNGEWIQMKGSYKSLLKINVTKKIVSIPKEEFQWFIKI